MSVRGHMSTRIATARWTGVFYLGLAVGGAIGYLFVLPPSVSSWR